MRSVWKKSSHCSHNESGLPNIHVTWQPRRVDWNLHMWPMIPVIGCGGHHGVSMCTVWPPHSKWLSEESSKSASDFVLSLNISLWKLFAWLRRPQLWATGDWQLHDDNTPAHASHLVLRFLVKWQITQVTQPPYSPDSVPCNFWLFPKLKLPLKGKTFQTIDEIQENTWQDSSWQFGERCEVPRSLVWRRLRCHCPMHNISCALYLLQEISLL